jgi:(R,R)-butanediol dehydrogenase/meso-butanediol dehydrogenase/diacetyl reductase
VADKRIQAEPFITGRVNLDEVIAGGFEQLITNKDQHVKILVSPSQ